GILWQENGKFVSMTDFQDNPMGLPSRSIHSAPGSERGEWNLTDDLLLRRVSDRDASAMTELFDRYGGMVYSVALRVLRDPARAEDLLQDIFLQLWKKPESFVSSRGSLGAWLLVVTRNRAIDVLRRRRSTESVDDYPLASEGNLASEVERGVMMDRVRGALTGLPPEQRNVLELAYFEGLSQTEIADRTGNPLGTVKTRMRSGLASLRKALHA
ncbi:MAG TPA: sigma-70 family RNA polymerase sigma factor, partial [Edaphobacter sp.]|nr:sigma-70 family RNA polymerase sigma factor [Edaphobacter sp.]